MAAWYRQWYGVELDPDTEILPLIGSKEGIMHICMTYLNEGDACAGSQSRVSDLPECGETGGGCLS